MADSKITQLTEDTAPALTDLLVTVEDPAGTPVTKKVTIQNLFNLFAADAAAMEAGSATDKFVTPALQHRHPSAAKVWVQGTPNSTTIISSYNVASLSDTATGQQTVTIATDFSSASYCVNVTVGDTGTTTAKSDTVMTKAAGSFIMNAVVEAGSGSDPTTDWNAVGFGDQ